MVSVPSVYLKKMDTSMSTKVTPPVSIIFRGSDDPGHYVWSPFVTKLEFRLRLAGIPYRIGAGNPWLGPKGKIPYVELAADTGAGPTMLGDSTLITKHLIESSALDDLNGGLTSAEKTRDLAIRALLEDKLYFYHVRTVAFFVQRHHGRFVDAAVRCANAGSITITSNVTKPWPPYRSLCVS